MIDLSIDNESNKSLWEGYSSYPLDRSFLVWDESSCEDFYFPPALTVRETVLQTVELIDSNPEPS